MSHILNFIFAPGFFQSAQVAGAASVGCIVAVMSGITGVFVIIRNQAFAGHAIAEFGGAGAAAAFLIGADTFVGFLGFGTAAAVIMELLGHRAKERDIVTGIVLSAALGLESLFLFLDAHYTGNASAPMMILFGSIFFVSRNTVAAVAVLSVVTAILMAVMFRPLLLCSINYELAKTRGIPVRVISLLFILLLSFVVEEGSLVAGALLSMALLIGPAAAATRISHRIGRSMAIASIIGIIAMLAGIILAYDSTRWTSGGRGWPVSFFVCAIILIFYVAARNIQRLKPKVMERRPEKQ